MTTLIEFELNGIKYSENNGRYYKTEDGKKTRISKAAYEEAAAEWTEMVKGKAEQDAEQDEIDAIVAEINHEQNEANDFTNIGNKEIEERKTKLPKGVRIESMYDGDTFIFMVMRGEEHVSSHWTRESACEAAMKLDPIEEQTPDKPTEPTRVKKPRKSKDIAHESKHGVTLTAKQVDFIMHLPDSDFWTDGLDSEIWVDCLCDEIGGQFFNKPMTVGAMISTLCEKKLGVRCRQKVNGRMATSFKLTDLGKMIASELGIY